MSLSVGTAKLVCIDQNETGMFYLQQELRQRKDGTQLVFCVGDVSDTGRMRRCFSEHHVECIFHAAAYKHVPVMEENVAEAIRNNVLALWDLLQIAEEQTCKSFVLISSDKAVNPTSVMGASKRICELVMAARPSKNMCHVSVRFGNVLGSSGSVVPILQEQLRQGRALTVTHPEIQRFFMTIQEAVALVVEASAIGNNGDILVLEMGTPVRIVDMARTLIRLSGRSEESTPIQFTGLREGEKLEEELFYAHETVLPTTFEKIRRVNGFKPDWSQLQRQLKELRLALTLDGAGAVRAKVKEIVPEYSFQSKHTNHGVDEPRTGSQLRATAGRD